MSSNVVRLGDTFVGYCNGPGHTPNRPCVGTYTTASSDVYVNNIPVVRIGDTGITDCGHVVTVVEASATVSANNELVHRVGDVALTEGGGVVVATSGSEDTISG